jgi:bacterioferritin-associated ferredoxin
MALVCLCHGVNERRIRREIEHGASTLEQIGAVCKAGTCCMGCHPTIDELLAEHEAVTSVTVGGRQPRFRVA